MMEVLIAAVVMLVGISGIMSLFMVAASKNVSQGQQASRTSEYAQDKMEQLLAANYYTGSTAGLTSNSTYTVTGGNCSSLTAAPDPGSPVSGFVDYITEGTAAGTEVSTTQPASPSYIRVWCILPTSTPSTGIMQVSVVVKSLRLIDTTSATNTSLAPSTTLVSYKAWQD